MIPRSFLLPIEVVRTVVLLVLNNKVLPASSSSPDGTGVAPFFFSLIAVVMVKVIEAVVAAVLSSHLL